MQMEFEAKIMMEAKQDYELALMEYTKLNRQSEELLVGVRKFDPSAMVKYSAVAQELHRAKQELHQKTMLYFVAEAQYAYSCAPEGETVKQCVEERKAYEKAVKEFADIRKNTLKAWYELEEANSAEQLEVAQKTYKEWEHKLYGAPHAYERAVELYAYAWKRTKQK